MSFVPTSTANLSGSDNKWYEAELARRHAEIEALLWQQKEKEWLEYQAWKEVKIMKWKRLKKEVWRKEEEYQRNLAHCLEVDCVATIEQQYHKN